MRTLFYPKEVFVKKKNNKAHAKKIKQFRYHCVEIMQIKKKKKIWHPTYVFLLIGNTYRYVIITHSRIVNDEINIELKKNPNPKDNKKSYRSPDIKTDTKDKFGRPRKDWKMDPLDDLEIRLQNKNDDSAD